MHDMTLFKAYVTARNRMESVRGARDARTMGNGATGIMAADDAYALEYQRYQRLAYRIEHRLGIKWQGEYICPVCARPKSHCDRYPHDASRVHAFAKQRRERNRELERIWAES